MTSGDNRRISEPETDREDENVDEGQIVSVVLAAGAGRRFGGRKQLALLAGRPLVEHALAAAAAASTAWTLLVLGSDAEEIERGIELGRATTIRCPDWEKGQGASLRCGLAALGPDVAAALISLGDEPFVSPEAARRVIAARHDGAGALRATYSGRPGHPVLIERALFERLIATPPDLKPATFLRTAGVVSVDCSDLGDPADVDTPEQLAELRRPRGEPVKP
jgi:molybdenum cofactor cytidylyltransferase